MEKMLQELEGVVVYIDDILVTGKTDQEHLRNLEQVFKRLLEHDLRLKKKKCQLLQPSVDYLGYIVDAEGLRPLPDKVEAITKALRPQSVKELRSFLGLVGYYRQLIADMSTLTKPLNDSCSRAKNGCEHRNVRVHLRH